MREGDRDLPPSSPTCAVPVEIDLLGDDLRFEGPLPRSLSQDEEAHAVGACDQPDLIAVGLDTELEATQAPISRVLLIGACQMSHLVLTTKLFDATRRAAGATEVDHFLFNNYARLPDVPPRAASEYDFQAISIPLRNVVPDETFSRLSFDDLAGFERVFEESCSRLHVLFDETMRWSRQYGMLTFVANFLEPQQNSMGRLLPRNDLRNFANFVARLNDVLDDWVRECPNAYTFDINSIAANFGRRYFQDDVF